MSDVNRLVSFYQEKSYEFDLFGSGVRDFFIKNPILNQVIHSIKYRLKDINHIKEKISRKQRDNSNITIDNLFEKITDFAGVRVLHLYPQQFEIIHQEIQKKIHSGDWVLFELPKAYTWDPETKQKYEELGITTHIKDSYYTSVHYVVKPPNQTNPITCEIQIRTLFEEVWGEIDHSINYPSQTKSVACREQLKAFAKLCAAGTKLSDSIIASYREYEAITTPPSIANPLSEDKSKDDELFDVAGNICLNSQVVIE